MKYVLSLLFTLTCVSIHAQMISSSNSNEKFIEVKVSDTMMVNPDIISLMVSLGNGGVEETDYFNSSDKNDGGSEEAEQKRKNDEIRKRNAIEEVLKKNNVFFRFHEKKADKNLFSKEAVLYENAYEVILKNESLVEKIKKELSAVKDVACVVAETKIGDKEKYELLLIDKVMKKANREAAAIAKAMGVTLDKPLNVSNQSMDNAYSSMFNNPESMGGLGAMFSMMGNMFKGGDQQSTQVTISKSLVVRYGIK